MSSSTEDRTRLTCGIVLHVREATCHVATDTGAQTVRYAPHFPSPRVERVSPGHLVALARASDGDAVVVWRWYDAVVLGERDDLVELWEPAHGDVLARPGPAYVPARPGARAYLSAGLPGADWWVAGPAVADPGAADVELGAVVRLYTEHDLWDRV